MLQKKFNFLDEEFCWKYSIEETFHNDKAINNYKKKLYHYTSQQGLIGILENQKLWATEYSFLNDSTELNYGMKLCIESLQHKVEKYSNKKLDSYVAMIKKHLKDRDRKKSYYVTSFSENKDQLSQWKGYAQDGQGFSLGFNLQEFSRWKRKNILDVKIYIQPVIYDLSQQQADLEKIFNNLIKHILKMDKNDLLTDDLLDSIVTASVYLFELKSIFFKSSAFQEENEWRIVYDNPSKNHTSPQLERKHVYFRITESKITPYIELDIQKEETLLPIKKIIVGSKNNISEIEKIVNYIYVNFDRIDLIPQIELSKIPLK